MVVDADLFVGGRKFFEPAERAALQQHVAQAKRRAPGRETWLDWFLVELALQTGLRAGELAALTCGDLRPEGARPGVLVRRGKGGKPRYVRIGRPCCQIIRRYLRWKRSAGEPTSPSAFVFKSPYRDGPLTVRALQKRFARLLGAVGLAAHTLHHCRHTYATSLYAASGANLRLVQKQLGHAKITTTQIYADVFDAATQQAMERLYRPASEAADPHSRKGQRS